MQHCAAIVTGLLGHWLGDSCVVQDFRQHRCRDGDLASLSSFGERGCNHCVVAVCLDSSDVVFLPRPTEPLFAAAMIVTPSFDYLLRKMFNRFSYPVDVHKL